MPEVPHSGEDHRKACLIGGGDHFLVADRAARLDHGARACFGSGDEAVGKGEEGVRGDRATHRTGGVPAIGLGRFLRLDRGDTRGIAPVHLARADPGGRAVLGVNDGV